MSLPIPNLKHPLNDPILLGIIQFWLTKNDPSSSEEGVRRLEVFSKSCFTKEALANLADCERTPPTVENFDSFGVRIDLLHTTSGWKWMKKFAAMNALVAQPYVEGGSLRLEQFMKIMLWVPLSGMVTCPLAMTDGAAKVLSKHAEYKDYFDRLTSTDPEVFAQSGQWMTERLGGSDLSNTETIATKTSDGSWKLNGMKWFSSATDAAMSLALAKTSPTQLSLFLVDLDRDKEKNIQILRLKKKHGTHPLPTAELLLTELPVKLIGELGKGVKEISTLLNITRIHNSIASIGYFSRSLQVLMEYSRVRLIGRKYLIEMPLQQRTLAKLQILRLGVTHLVFYVVYLLGREESNTGNMRESLILRGLTSLVKAYSAKKCYEGVQECVEGLGGLGYIENADVELNVSRMLRDSLVLTIWEGTTNVLSLDFWRVLSSPSVMNAFKEEFGIEIKAPKEEGDFRDEMFAVANELVGILLTGIDIKYSSAWHAGVGSKEMEDLLISTEDKVSAKL